MKMISRQESEQPILMKMGNESFELQNARSAEPLMAEDRKGFVVSTATGLALVLLAVLIAVGVGIIVYFAGVQNVKCTNDVGGTGAVVGKDCDCSKVCPTLQPVTAATTTAVSTSAASSSVTTVTPVTGSTTAPPPGKVSDVRLPRWLIPIEYTINMKPDIYQADPKDFKNTGQMSVIMHCDASTKTVTIHANKLNITSRKLTEVGSATELQIRDMIYDEPRQFVNFTLDADLTVGKKYKLELSYEGPLVNDLAGLYYSTYTEIPPGNATPQKKYIATTQFQPTDARKAFPCFDEPEWKANFTVSIQRKETMTALSNMPLFNSTTLNDGWVKDNFQTTVKMSTYLLAMIVCDFAYKNGTTKQGTEFKVWAKKSAINQTDFALEEGIEMLTYFEDFFGEPYPLPKSDMIAIPDFAAGAMENWGLITYRETALLYDPKVSAAVNKQRVSVVVSHELAHQWFGNLVTPKWWDDLWLNEGFASYVEYIGVNHTQPDWDMMEQFVVDDVQDTMKADSLATSHPIYVPVGHPDEINEIFDSISYGKGGSLLRMIRFFLGDVVFKNALINYIDNKRFGVAFHKDLWAEMQIEADKQGITDDKGSKLQLSQILDTWLLQMGFPVVTVEEGAKPGGRKTLVLKQKHFLQDPSQQPDPKYPSPFGYTWDIPISFTTNKAPNFDVTHTDVKWFFKSNSELTLEVDNDVEWVIVNPKQYGFYRVNYPTPYWNKITDQLKSNHEVIDPLSRAQLLDDSFNLALAGNLSIDFAMQLTEYLKNETSYFPWQSVIGSLDYVSSALSQTKAYGNFERYYKNLITPLYNQASNDWNISNSDPITEQYKQSLSIARACRYNVGDCRQRATELLKRFMDNNQTNPIHPNVRSTVYCYGIKAGGVAEWEFILQRFRSEDTAVEAVKLLQALGCTDQEWLLQRLLDYSIDESVVRRQDAYIAAGAVANNQLGRYLVWNWFRSKWDDLNVIFSSGLNMLGRFVQISTNNFFTQFDLDQIKAFIADKKDLKTASRAFAQAQERTAANIKYLARNYKTLEDWLSRRS